MTALVFTTAAPSVVTNIKNKVECGESEEWLEQVFSCEECDSHNRDHWAEEQHQFYNIGPPVGGAMAQWGSSSHH